MAQAGIQNRVCDCNFLMGLADLINDQNLGPDVVLGKNMQKAMPYFIQSVKINLAGNNAFSKV